MWYFTWAFFNPNNKNCHQQNQSFTCSSIPQNVILYLSTSLIGTRWYPNLKVPGAKFRSMPNGIKDFLQCWHGIFIKFGLLIHKLIIPIHLFFSPIAKHVLLWQASQQLMHIFIHIVLLIKPPTTFGSFIESNTFQDLSLYFSSKYRCITSNFNLNFKAFK